MLVNAHDFPGPALFQGIGFIVILFWALWLFRDKTPKKPDIDWRGKLESFDDPESYKEYLRQRRAQGKGAEDE